MKKIILSLFLIGVVITLKAQNPEAAVQANLDAYNNRDIETFMLYISEEIEMYRMGECEPYSTGKQEVKNTYKRYFENSPKLHSEIKKRIVYGNKVIDHEYITGANGSEEAFELILIYEVIDGLIVKMTSIRKTT
ncbi:MAG: hypothetical protein CMP59_07850 [Flavobacteriales bacterium]|nr:hypothetical protein [Flavobacteriales bacterium]